MIKWRSTSDGHPLALKQVLVWFNDDARHAVFMMTGGSWVFRIEVQDEDDPSITVMEEVLAIEIKWWSEINGPVE